MRVQPQLFIPYLLYCRSYFVVQNSGLPINEGRQRLVVFRCICLFIFKKKLLVNKFSSGYTLAAKYVRCFKEGLTKLASKWRKINSTTLVIYDEFERGNSLRSHFASLKDSDSSKSMSKSMEILNFLPGHMGLSRSNPILSFEWNFKILLV